MKDQLRAAKAKRESSMRDLRPCSILYLLMGAFVVVSGLEKSKPKIGDIPVLVSRSMFVI